MGLLDDSIREIESNYIPVSIFIDLVAMQKESSIIEVARYLLFNDLDNEVDTFFIDKAYRISKLEDNFVTNFLEKIVDNANHFKDKGRLPINIVKGEHLVTHQFKVEQIRKALCLNKLKLDLSDKTISTEKSIILKNRRADIVEMYKAEYTRNKKRPYKLFLYDYLNIDQIASLMTKIDLDFINIMIVYDEIDNRDIVEKFWSCKNFLRNEIKANRLQPNEHGMFDKDQVQQFLYDNGFVIDGFNDYLRIEPIKTSYIYKTNKDAVSKSPRTIYANEGKEKLYPIAEKICKADVSNILAPIEVARLAREFANIKTSEETIKRSWLPSANPDEYPAIYDQMTNNNFQKDKEAKDQRKELKILLRDEFLK